MRLVLEPHPESRTTAVTGIEVDVHRTDVLSLRYVVIGAIHRLLLPPVSAPSRTDELWKHTCFEAFVRPGAGDAYTEFNFAPSTHWAAYCFAGYRSGMQAADIAAPTIEARAGADRYELTARLALPTPGAARLGLSAIIEETDGAKSYWALAHPPGRPDFHHADSFAYDLA